MQVKKNRITGKDRTITMPIYHSYGIDDVGACVDYLTDEGIITKSKSTLTCEELDVQGSRDAIIDKIQTTGQEKKLSSMVAEHWKSIEAACSIKRKSRYE